MPKAITDPELKSVFEKLENQKIYSCLEKSTIKEFKIYFMDTDIICVKLQSSERSDRQKGLKLLLEFCENQLTKPDTLISVYDDCYIHILKCYSDRYENCRELACNVITEFIKRLPKNEYYLQHIINAIMLRCGQKEIQEESEEMRLIYLEQLNFLIFKFRCDKLLDNNNDDDDSKARIREDFLLKSYNEIIDILLKALTDPYPAAQREACSCIKQLALATPSFHYRAETLTTPLFSMLHHKYSINRIVAIETLGIICLHISTNSNSIVQIISEISPLLMDPTPLVRKECGKIGCMWLLKLRDRYSYFERILPLPLCCLNDDSPDVRQHIEELWLKCGQRYYEENENELNKIEIFDRKAKNYPEDVKRPILGCRALVQKNLRLIKTVMYETSDWKEKVRLHSLKLLWQIVVHAEAALTAKFMDIYPDLCTVCADSDVNVSKAATKVAELMGNLLNYEQWFQLALEHLEQYPKIGCLKCFYFLYFGSDNTNSEDVLTIAKMLAKNKFSNSLKPEMQMYLLKLIDVLLERYQFKSNTEDPIQFETAMEKMKLENDETEKYLYHTLIKIIALSFDDINPDNPVQTYGQKLLRKFVKYNEELIPILHSTCLNSVIETFDSLDIELDAYAEPILLLCGIIRTCGFQKIYLNSLKKSVQTVLEHGTTDAKLKIFTAISIAMLSWNKTMYDLENVDDNVSLLREFVKDIVEPHLMWKPGANTESLRSMATMTLCSITQGAPEEAPKILPEFASYFPNLIEDISVKTRIYAVRCLTNFGPMKYEYLRPIAYAVTQRLDDFSLEVRKCAIQALCKFDSNAIQDDEIESWYTFIKYALKLLFIHFDEPENILKNLIRDSLLEIGKQYPDLFIEPYNEALKTALYVEEIEEIYQRVKMFSEKE